MKHHKISDIGNINTKEVGYLWRGLSNKDKVRAADPLIASAGTCYRCWLLPFQLNRGAMHKTTTP
jgi:hypothetical protein